MSVCDPANSIGNCAPHASLRDVIEFLQEFCKECYGTVPQYTDEANFCNVAFGGAADVNCDYLLVKRDTAPNEEFFISVDCVNWYQITFEDPVGYVPAATLQEDFLVTAWGAYVDMPDATTAPIIFVVEGDCTIWIAVNDRTNCDLGTIPATPGTGLDWTLIADSGIERRLYIAGLEVDIDGNATGLIYPGSCRDDTNTVNIDNPANLAFDCTVIGANGLDANDVALSIDTWYYIYLIYGASGVAAFVSSAPAPVLPIGYSYKRRVGWARTLNPANFILTEMRDNIVMWSTTYWTILNNANIANGAYTAVSVAAVFPITTRWAIISGALGYVVATPIIYYSMDGVNLHYPRLLYFVEQGGCNLGFVGIGAGAATMYFQSTVAANELLDIFAHGYKDDRWDVS